MSRDGTVVGSIQTGSDGSFRFTLSPGTYSVVGSDNCPGSASAVVTSGGTTVVTVSCQVP